MGGVEMHIWCLAQCLLQKGHKVIVVTHNYSITPSSLATTTSTSNSSSGSSATTIATESSSTASSILSSSSIVQSTSTSVPGPPAFPQSPVPSLSPSAAGVHPNHSYHSTSVSNTHSNVDGAENSDGIPTAKNHESIHPDLGDKASLSDSKKSVHQPLSVLDNSTTALDPNLVGLRQGVRYMTNGLKVYYLPLTVCFDQVIYPTLFAFFPLFRNILIRERITIVHGHQSSSVLTNECLLYARCMGFRVCYTDHSLFGFSDLASIHMNQLLKMTLSDVDHVICVSNTCRENLVLRACLHPALVSTIPNAVDATRFTPDISKRRPVNTINVVLLSRLVYRKGIDLLVKVIPSVCAKVNNVYFIIGGDGPKKLLLEEMLRDVLVRGHIFLNCSLTESFCIALLEAASCGLFVVSTKVGGVPEVLPPSMINFAEPNVESLSEALIEAVSICRGIRPAGFHERIKSMYSWMDVTQRTIAVYNNIAMMRRPSLSVRILRYSTVGTVSGFCTCFIVVWMHILWRICESLWPADQIEICPDIVLSVEKKSDRQSRIERNKKK
eukprot:gene32910-42594_t